MRLNTLMPTPIRDAATNTQSRGLPVIMVNTSPTRVVIVLVAPRTADRPVEVSEITPFFDESPFWRWLRAEDLNLYLRVESPAS